MYVGLTPAGRLPSVREMILKLPLGSLSVIEMVRGLGVMYTVQVVHFMAIEKGP